MSGSRSVAPEVEVGMMKALDVEESILEGLSNDLQDSLRPDPKMESREKAALRIQLMLEGMARKYHIKGEVKMFGSFSNGFKTGSSDMDVVLLTPLVADAVPLLKKFEAEMTPEVGIGNITKIYQASVPLLKLTDMKTGMEVDFCINNELGVRNSQLLHTYCEYDSRVLRLGRLVKDWAKKHELVGTADGCLNSYAYMLLVIYYLQTLEEPVLPNLQEMATESVLVTDMKWGCSDRWETKFWTDVSSLEPSKNTATVAELLIGFFHYYVKEFDWSSHAVCMRLNKSGENVDKFKLNTPTTKDQWYVEDPFDLRHNLAGKCSIAGKARILKKMEESLEFLKQPGGWEKACPSGNLETYLLKLRVSTSVTAHSLLEMFEEFDLTRLYFPKPESNVRMAQAYLEFSSYSSRRRAHTCNERWIADDCQLQLHYSTQHSLSEAIDQGNISTYEMASYKMQRQVFAARMMSQSGGSGATRLGPGNFPENLSMQPGSGAPGGVDPAAAPAFNFMWSGSAQSAGGNPQHPPRQMMQHAGPMVQMGWPNGMPPGPGNGQPGQIPPQPPGNNTARPPGPPPGPPPPEAHMVPSMANFMQMQMQQQQMMQQQLQQQQMQQEQQQMPQQMSQAAQSVHPQVAQLSAAQLQQYQQMQAQMEELQRRQQQLLQQQQAMVQQPARQMQQQAMQQMQAMPQQMPPYHPLQSLVATSSSVTSGAAGSSGDSSEQAPSMIGGGLAKPKGWDQCLHFARFVKEKEVTGIELVKTWQATCQPAVRSGRASERYRLMCNSMSGAIEPYASQVDYNIEQLCDTVLALFHDLTAADTAAAR
mmetsp:Transcript_38407/g.97440  ORF Transcript_38407/g.97440 Transcript_38407/m.97440 type:complete len:818 (+) Transcript_38407:13-2466(+)